MNKTPEKFKIEFDPKRYKYLLQVHAQDLKRWEEPPLHLLETAVSSQIEDQFPKRMHHAQIFMERVKAVWNAFPRYPDQSLVQLVLAELYPDMPGLVVDMDTVHHEQVLITLPRNPELISAWHPAWIEAFANAKLKHIGSKSTVNSAQLRIMYSRAAHFHEAIENYPISTAGRSNPLKSGKDYHVLAHAQRLELELVVGAIHALADEGAQRLLMEEIDEALWKLIHAYGRTPFLKDFRKPLRKALQDAQLQPQAVGIEVPLVLPVAFFLKEEDQSPKLAELKTIAAHFQSRHPELLQSQVSHYHRDEMKERTRLLQKRGIPGSASLYPVSSLPMMDKDLSNEFLAFARHGRSTFLSSQRELQAMVFTIPGTSAERYGKAMEGFWREFIQTYGTNKDEGKPVTVISHFFPMSVNPRERKPIVQGRKRQDNDSASWLPMIVREIIALPSVPADPASIASCLAPNVSEGAVKKALESLLNLGMISYDAAARRYHQRERNVVTGDEKAHEKILRIHEEMSELAAAVLDDPPPGMRSLALHVLIEPAQFEHARQRIREWLHGLLEQTTKERDQDQLFQLSIQMFQGPT
jgi:hypothetical protein